MRRAVLTFLVLALVLPVWAQDGANLDRAQRRVATYLQLTDEQVTQWDALLEERQLTVAPLNDEIEASREQLGQQLEGDDPDPTAVGELTITIHGLRQAVAEAHEVYASGFVALLDEEQARRYQAVRGAQRLQPLLPAFHALGLLPRR